MNTKKNDVGYLTSLLIIMPCTMANDMCFDQPANTLTKAPDGLCWPAYAPVRILECKQQFHLADRAHKETSEQL